MSRYARQELVIGTQAQRALAQAHVLVVGAGGLGSPVLQYLCGAGVGDITIVDHDHVEESNLHRQPLYRLEDIGRPKAIAACEHLRAANPYPRLHPQVYRLSPTTAKMAISQADVVIDAADSFAVSYILSDLCLAAGLPLISASVLGQTGYVGGYCGSAPSIRAVFPDLPSTAGSCAQNGVLGPVVGMVGTTQAQMALAYLSGQDPTPLGRLLTLDAKNFGFGGFDFSGAEEPEAAIGFVDASALSHGDQLIELRSEQESPTPFAPQARRVLPQDIQTTQLDPNSRVVLACQTGLRAWHAGQALQTMGFGDIALFAQSAS
ncbi:MAG: ThiF family adenylyltransferase [Pelagimonas sp.]|uniref:HesA/MoeB/ThiF family protein n=1 Tax=Pelagimonas sp. TaxID=2073170 RepID=UPI003D6AA4B6